jgi:hypothetical protein
VLILLPIAAFVAIFLVLLDSDPADGIVGAGGSFLRAAVLWGAYLAVTSELLSLLDVLSRLGVAVAWLAILIGVLVLGRRRGSLRRGLAKVESLGRKSGATERWIVGALVVLGGTLLLVAWVSPPNNVDSLLYHVSRVVHWAQDQSLRHYATGYNHQLLKPIWAETAILHLRLLWGSDHPANLVQWFSMIGSLVGVVALAASFGGNRTGLVLTAAFVVTIPMGILQATSTQNDYVVAFWAICTAFLVAQAAMRPPPLLDRVCLALVLGLGFLTKGTYYVYAPLFVGWYFLVRWRQVGVRRMAVEGVAIAVLACALNLGFWARNVATFGGPYGTSEWLQRNLWIRIEASDGREPAGAETIAANNQDLVDSDPAAGPASAGDSVGAQEPGLIQDMAARVLRTGAFNLVTPIGRINELILAALGRAPAVFGDRYIEDWRTVAWNHEDTAPNPLHFFVILAAAGLAISLKGPAIPGKARLYALVVLGCYLMIPVVIGHGPSIWGIRYQLPFFILGAPIVAWVATRLNLRLAAPLVAGALMLMALPWLAFNNTRPLVGRTPWPTRIGSILWTSPPEILLASNPRLVSSYTQGAELIRESGCTQVGLRIDSDELEYSFWWLLRAPQSGIRLESIYPTARSQSLMDPAFRPCAILCTICSDRDRLHGLPLAADFDRLDVFLGSGYVPDPNG